MKTKHIDLERRFGKFVIKRHLIDDAPNQVFQILRKFLVVRAEMLFAIDSIEYTALSTLFDRVPEAAEVPTYDITCIYLDDELVDLEVTLK